MIVLKNESICSRELSNIKKESMYVLSKGNQSIYIFLANDTKEKVDIRSEGVYIIDFFF